MLHFEHDLAAVCLGVGVVVAGVAIGVAAGVAASVAAGVAVVVDVVVGTADIATTGVVAVVAVGGDVDTLVEADVGDIELVEANFTRVGGFWAKVLLQMPQYSFPLTFDILPDSNF